ncbi:MAG: hypothetical protein Kow0020_04440 [Wenzhouxiangellaceae bacterium]
MNRLLKGFSRLGRSRLLAGTLLAGALVLGVVPVVQADSLREVAQRVAREHDGKVISARVVEIQGRRYYEIRILTRDGVVRTVRIPARER